MDNTPRFKKTANYLHSGADRTLTAYVADGRAEVKHDAGLPS